MGVMLKWGAGEMVNIIAIIPSHFKRVALFIIWSVLTLHTLYYHPLINHQPNTPEPHYPRGKIYCKIIHSKSKTSTIISYFLSRNLNINYCYYSINGRP